MPDTDLQIHSLPLNVQHVSTCAALWSDRAMASGDEFAGALDKVAALLTNRLARGALLVDQHSRPRYFGLSAFVTPAFAEQFVRRPHPQLGARLLREWSPCSGGPILGEAEVADGNAGSGLCLAVLAQGWDLESAGADPWRALFGPILGAFIGAHRGFRLAGFIGETFGAEGVKIITSANALPMCRTFSTAGPDGEHPSVVYALSRDEAVSRWSLLTPLFNYAAPRLRLTKMERELLLEASSAGTDAALAGRLGVEPSAVKARWTRIYDKVSRLSPEIVGPNATAGVTRGPQKRHLILDYVRANPSELTPFRWSAPGGKRP